MHERSHRLASVARQLCSAEGWELDDLIPVEGDLNASGSSSAILLSRWHLYMRAAETQVAQEDNWEVF